LGIDLPFVTPFLLVEAELSNERPVFLVEFSPNLGSTLMLDRRILVTGGIGGFGMGHRSDDQAKQNG